MNPTDISMPRREMLKNIGLATTAAMTLSLTAKAETQDHNHAHHMHATDPKLQRVIDATLDCVKKGETCSQHCIELFKTGDTTVANCADTVQQMLASCTALSKLALHNSRHLKSFMQACVAVCEDCEKECKKHADKHTACKDCADSCAECIKACKDYLA